jgi:hypothetical protein
VGKISHRYAVRTPALAGGARDDKHTLPILVQIILSGREMEKQDFSC